MVQLVDLTVQQFDPIQVLAEQLLVNRAHRAAQSIGQNRTATAQALIAKFGQLLRIRLAIGQSSQNAPPAGPQQVADHRRELDTALFQQALYLIL